MRSNYWDCFGFFVSILLGAGVISGFVAIVVITSDSREERMETGGDVE